MRPLFFLSLLLALVVRADFLLVENGEARCSIVLPIQNRTKSAQLAAFELQYHLQRMTGAVLPICATTEESKTPNRIFVGGKGTQPLQGDGCAIEFQGKTLCLFGNDSPLFDKVDYQKESTFPQPYDECKGTLFAVYDFLEGYCGIRFFGMRDTDTYYPPTKTLAVQETNRIHESPMDAFRYIYIDDPSSVKRQFTPRDITLFRLRWRNTVHYGLVNHNHYSIYFNHWGKALDPKLSPLFKGQNKDMFGKGFDGKNHSVDPLLRSNYPKDRDIPPQVCYSSSDAVQFFAQEALTYAKGGCTVGGWRNWRGKHPVSQDILPHIPGKPYFYPLQGGDTGGYCLCERCRKRFPGDTKDNVSDNKFQFMGDVARAVAKEVPTAGIATEGYIETLGYPRHVQLPSNLSVMLCLTQYSWWHPVARKFQMGAYKEWVEKEARRRPVTVYTYLFSTYWDARHHYGDYSPFPGFYPQATIDQFQMFARDGIKGWFTEVEMRYQFLEAYLASRICYDPSLDAQKLLKEFFSLYYGEAGDVMAAIYRDIESGYWNQSNCLPDWLKSQDVVIGPNGKKHPYWTTGLWSQQLCWEKLGTKERVERINTLLAEAKQKARTPQEKLHLEHFLKTIWEPALEGEKEYTRLQKLRSQPAPTLSLWQIAEADGHPENIPWDEIPSTGYWNSLAGGDTPLRCSLKAARDSRYLYIRFQEDTPAPKSAEMWRDDVELFFAPVDRKYILQYAISPTGETDQLKHTVINGERQMTYYDFKATSKITRLTDKWLMTLTIPLERLPIVRGNLVADFFRITPKHEACWAPVYCGRFTDGLTYFGYLNFLPMTLDENDFTLYHRGELSGVIQDAEATHGKAAWMQADQSWAIMVRTDRIGIRGKAKVSIRLRTEAAFQRGATTGVGVFNRKTDKTLRFIPISVEKVNGKKYATLELGEVDFSDETYLFVRSITPKTSPDAKIYVDEFILHP